MVWRIKYNEFVGLFIDLGLALDCSILENWFWDENQTLESYTIFWRRNDAFPRRL